MPDNENIKTQTSEQGQDKQPQQPQHAFRGVAVHLAVDGSFGLEMVGVTKMEVFGALTLIIEKLKKDFQA